MIAYIFLKGAIGLTGRRFILAQTFQTCLRTFGWKSAIHRAQAIKHDAHPIKISAKSGVTVDRPAPFYFRRFAVYGTLFEINSALGHVRVITLINLPLILLFLFVQTSPTIRFHGVGWGDLTGIFKEHGLIYGLVIGIRVFDCTSDRLLYPRIID